MVERDLELEAFLFVINLLMINLGYLLWMRMYLLLQTASRSSLQLESRKDQWHDLDSENALLD